MRRVVAASNRTFVVVECLPGAEKLCDLDPGGKFQPEVLRVQDMWIVEVPRGIVVTASGLPQVGSCANYLEALLRRIAAAETVNYDASLVNVDTTTLTQRSVVPWHCWGREIAEPASLARYRS